MEVVEFRHDSVLNKKVKEISKLNLQDIANKDHWINVVLQKTPINELNCSDLIRNHDSFEVEYLGKMIEGVTEKKSFLACRSY